MTAELIPFRRAPDTEVLSYRDEEIVLRRRQGERAEETARALGYPIGVVLLALELAEALGIDTQRGPPRRP